MTITIKVNNINLINRYRNYFYNKDVQTMLCNDDTELMLFNLDREKAEFLLAAFAKHFHLRPTAQVALAS